MPSKVGLRGPSLLCPWFQAGLLKKLLWENDTYYFRCKTQFVFDLFVPKQRTRVRFLHPQKNLLSHHLIKSPEISASLKCKLGVIPLSEASSPSNSQLQNWLLTLLELSEQQMFIYLFPFIIFLIKVIFILFYNKCTSLSHLPRRVTTTFTFSAAYFWHGKRRKKNKTQKIFVFNAKLPFFIPEASK